MPLLRSSLAIDFDPLQQRNKREKLEDILPLAECLNPSHDVPHLSQMAGSANWVYNTLHHTTIGIRSSATVTCLTTCRLNKQEERDVIHQLSP